MFEGLKKKLSNFVESLSKKVKGKVKKERNETEKKEEKKESAKVERREKEKAEEPEKEEKKEEESISEITPKVKAKPTIFTKIKGAFLPEVTIKEEDISETLQEFETQLLEADVALPVATHLITDLESKIVGKKIRYKELDSFVKDSISSSINDLLLQEEFDIISYIKSKLEAGEKPVKLLFIGPNGAGKTTAIAKIAYLLKKNGFSSVISASDTFRKGSIEQTEEHASRIGVSVIKHQYGSDPTSVAFDAVKHAEANNINVVLIDTAGRQETSRNLIEQLKKIARVIKPDLNIFVGEGIVGNAIISQVSEFNKATPLDGIILTKVDCDSKGGTVISIKEATGIPIFYFGIGQDYEDLVKFDKNFILKRLFT